MKPIVACLSLLVVMTAMLIGCTHTADYRMCGTYMPYTYTAAPDVAAPEGYTLRYVSHIGRHGARYPDSPADMEYLIGVLTDAEQHASLSDKGRELLAQLRRIEAACDGRWGRLSPLGADEQRQIASRLAARFPTLAAGRINVLADRVERCQSSMQAFLGAIGGSDVKIMLLPEGNPVLDFFKLNTAYLDYKRQGPWRELYHAFADSVLSTDRPIRGLFLGAYADSLRHKVKFLHALFSVNAILPDTDVPYTLQDYFTGEEIYSLWSVENVRQYLEKGPSPVGCSLPTNICFALLRTILADADRALASQGAASQGTASQGAASQGTASQSAASQGTASQSAASQGAITADLRFTHAESIIPLTAMMQLSGCDASVADLPQINRTWFDFFVAPMAANVQLLFYGNPAGDWLLLPLLNERPVRLPVGSDELPFYPWPKVRAFYQAKLDSLRIDTTLSLTNQVRSYNVAN